MAFDSQEEEQIEAIKKWWKENGTAVILGVSLGVALLLGWKFWQNYQNKQAEEASMMYEQVMMQVKNKDSAKALEAGQALLAKHPDSLYATLTSLMMAKENLSANSASSEANLQWVIDNSKQSEWVNLARIRKARLLLSQNQLDEALGLIPATLPDSFKAAYLALKGDIYLAKNDIDNAKKAYDSALAEISFGGEARQIVQMQRDNLGGNSEDIFSGAKPTVEIIEAKANAVTLEQPSIEISPISEPAQ